MRRRWISACAIVCAAALCGPAAWAADQKGGKKHSQETAHGKGRSVERVDTRNAWMDRGHCRTVVIEYYDRHGLPPGLAKKRSLPPGLQKQLRERGHLPPGLERHAVLVPVEIEQRLPPLPPHHVRRIVGDDLLVIDVRAHLVVSIMAGVFTRR